MRKLKFLVAIAAISFVASGALAVTSFDFEDANSLDNWIVGGSAATPDYSLSTAQAHSGTQSMFVGADTSMTFDLGKIEPGVLTLWVYDHSGIFGAEGDYGPTWGMISESTSQYRAEEPYLIDKTVVGGGIVWKSSLNGENGYTMSYSDNAANGEWWMYHWSAQPRLRDQWSQWEITVRSDNTGTVRVVDGAYRNFNLADSILADGGVRGINITGGFTGDNMFTSTTGIWVDDIVWTPESELPPPDTRLDDFTFTGAGNAVAVDDMGAGTSTGSLYMSHGDFGWLRFADTPQFGALELKVFDKGVMSEDGASIGPRWGVLNNEVSKPLVPVNGSPEGTMVGAGIIWKSFLNGNNGYGAASGATPAAQTREGVGIRGWFGPKWSGVARNVGDDGEGEWSTWRIEVHEGGLYTITVNPGEDDEEIILLDGDPTNPNALAVSIDSIFYDSDTSSKGFNEFMLYGGDGNGAGVWYDDIKWIPDSGVGGFTYDFELGPKIVECRDINAAVGDFNCDGDINLLDLTTLGENYNTGGLDPETSYTLGDTNADGDINLLDLTTLGENYNTSIVPEPATLGLLAIGGLLAIRRR